MEFNSLHGDIGYGTSEVLLEGIMTTEDDPISVKLRTMSISNPPDVIHKAANSLVGDLRSADDKHLSELIDKHKDNLDPIRDHIRSVLLSQHKVAEKTKNPILANALTTKYGWAINHGLPKKSGFDVLQGNQFLNKDEIHKHTNDYNFVAGRIMQHKKLGTFHHLNEDGTIQDVGHYTTGEIKEYSKNVQRTLLPDSHSDSFNFHAKNLADVHGKHIQNNPEVKSIVKTYTGDSGEINRMAVSKNKGEPPKGDFLDKEEAEANIHKMRSAITSAPSYEYPMRVYSGLTKSSNPANGLPKDGMRKSHFPAFTSTSLDVGAALDFAVNNTRGDKDPSIKQHLGDFVSLKIPANHGKGLYVETHTENPLEFEYIVHDNQHVVHDKEPKYIALHGKLIRTWEGKLE